MPEAGPRIERRGSTRPGRNTRVPMQVHPFNVLRPHQVWQNTKHILSAILDNQADTRKPVGKYFRLPQHNSSHMKCLVFEKVFSHDKF